MCTCNDMNCLISLAVDGLLDGPDKTALEQHMNGCAACRRKLADLTAIRAELARPVEAPADLHGRIMGAVAAHEKQRKLRRLLKKTGSVAAVLVICLMVAGGAALLDSGFMSAKGAESADAMAPMMTGAGAAMGSTTAGSASGYSGSSESTSRADTNDVAPQEPMQEALTGGAMTVPTPSSPVNPNPSGPVANGAFRVLVAGEGIAFAGTYAFNLFVEGDPEEIKKVLGVQEADEKAEGYVILQVPGDLDQVWDDLAKMGCTVAEDDRNGFTNQGPALEYGLVSVKLK